MYRRSNIIALCAVLVLSTVAGSVLAGEESGTETLEWIDS